MKTQSKFTVPVSIGLFAAIFLFACADGNRESAVQDKSAGVYRMADSISAAAPPAVEQSKLVDQFLANTNEKDQADFLSGFQNVFSSSASRMNSLDSTHRFIRTGDIKFRVNNVAAATYRIEDITARFGGYVADTKLTSELQSRYEVPVSTDSSLETMRYVVTNTILIRVPARNLDTAIKSLVPLIDYLDYRNINTNDITLSVLSNQLAQRRNANYNSRLSHDIDSKGTKLPDVQSAEESILRQQESSDNAMIENLRLDDQVRYSTVTIQIYQRESIRQELIKREKTIDAYEPGFGTKLSEGLSSGWKGLRFVITLFVTVWPLWIFGAGIWIFIRWLIKKNEKAAK